MIKKNEFETICDKLENCNKKCKSNPIICARRYINEYAEGDKDRLLKLKAEGGSIEYKDFLEMLFSMLACLFSGIFLILSIIKTNTIMSIYALTIIATCILIALKGMNAFGNVRKYQKYILIVIEDELKEID